MKFIVKLSFANFTENGVPKSIIRLQKLEPQLFKKRRHMILTRQIMNIS